VDFPGRADERDAALVRRLRQNADNARMYLREWIQQELKEIRIELQVLQTIGGAAGPNILSQLDRIEELDRERLVAIDAAFDERLDDIDNGGYDNASHARDELEAGLRDFEAILRDLLKIREFVIQQRGFTVTEA